MPTVAGDEDPLGRVDPDLLDRRVVEVGLERTEPGDPGHQLTDHRVDVSDRYDDLGQAALVVGTDHLGGDAAYETRVALRVDTVAPDPIAHQLVERLDQLRVRGEH
ncbi:MAG: hypothetical protein ACR2JU_08825 [Nocardioidaceae bacterium]